MSLSEIIALVAVVISIGTNVALYVHLSTVMNGRFDSVDRKFESVERRLEMILGGVHGMDLRISVWKGNEGLTPLSASQCFRHSAAYSALRAASYPRCQPRR